MKRLMSPACAVLLLVVATALSAQRTTGAAAFAIEMAGGSLGSAAGFTVVRVIAGKRDCGDDLSCVLGKAGAAVAASTAGAAGGTWLAGRSFRTEPSGAGAVIGAVLGAGAAVGVDHLIREEAKRSPSDTQQLLVFALVQGTVTALGSRLLARLRR